MSSVIDTVEVIHPMYLGTDVPIDVDAPDSLWRVVAEANPRKAMLQGKFEGGGVLTMRLNSSGAPIKTGNKARFKTDANSTAEWQMYEQHVKLLVTFSAAPLSRTLTVDFTVSQLDLSPDQGSIVVFKKDTHDKVATLPRPWIEYTSDTTGELEHIDLEWVLGSKNFSVTMPELSETEWTTAVLDPTIITTSTAATATAYSNQRKIDRCSNGVLWAFRNPGTSGQANAFDASCSTDDGATWTLATSVPNGSGLTSGTTGLNGSIFIDADDYCHVVFRDGGDGYIYYRRGTPNAGRTAWTWSAALQVYGYVEGNYPDVVAHREGAGWKAHVTYSGQAATYCRAFHQRIDITSGGTITLDGGSTLLGNHAVNAASYPSIDFHHTGDGKTVQGGTPHLYVGWSAGATGAGKGIRFKKATYAGGSWTWGTEREIDSTRFVAGDGYKWLNCLFDGTRVILGGSIFDTDYDLVLYERDVADTATITRVLISAQAGATWLVGGSLTYDSSGNVYLFGADNTGANGTRTLYRRKWSRASNTLEAAVVVEATAPNLAYVSAKRGYSNNRIEFIYTDGTASPYSVKYSFVGDEPELYPSLITTSTVATPTAYSNQRKLDRCSNGVLWNVHLPSSSSSAQWVFYYSINDGVTWVDSGTHVPPLATNQSQPVSGSLFIDVDDYAHFVYKELSNGSIYYRRGTPNAGRTAWTWSAATLISSNGNLNYPDIVAHRENTGWKAHVVISYRSGTANYAYYQRVNITSANVISLDGTLTQVNDMDYGASNDTWPSIDFHHTGDGKTVQGGTPHLYVGWSAGIGSGWGIRFKKVTYSSGTWTWGTERGIDTTRYVANFNYWINCMFDGTRVIIPGFLTSGSDNALVFHERDAADTTTTLRALLVGSAEADRTFVGSATYDGSGNIYVVGRTSGTANGSMTLAYRKWVRATDTLESPVAIEISAPTNLYASAKRGYSNNLVEFIYTDGTSSPYSVAYSQISLSKFAMFKIWLNNSWVLKPLKRWTGTEWKNLDSTKVKRYDGSAWVPTS